MSVTLVSPANPWLDFLDDAAVVATEINEDMEALCAGSAGRLYGLGLLPVRDPAAAAAELGRIAALPHLRGAVIGTTGAGRGLDDPAMDVVWAAAERLGLMIFVHPHYGLGNEALTGYGHAMPLALGFPFETTAAVARLILGGTFDRFPGLRLMVAHAGGVLPYLAGRLDGCVAGDAHSPVRLRHEPSSYLRKLVLRCDRVSGADAGFADFVGWRGADHVWDGSSVLSAACQQRSAGHDRMAQSRGASQGPRRTRSASRSRHHVRQCPIRTEHT